MSPTPHTVSSSLITVVEWLAEVVADRAVEKLEQRNRELAAQTTENGERMLSAADIGALISVTDETAREYLKVEGIRAVKLGGVLRYPAAAVEAWIRREQLEVEQQATRRNGRVVRLWDPEYGQAAKNRTRRQSATGTTKKAAR